MQSQRQQMQQLELGMIVPGMEPLRVEERTAQVVPNTCDGVA
jgi:hypothetical protein